MECPKCNSTNAETNKFCSQCGAPLDPSSCAIDDYICRQIKSTLETQIKDQNLVEMEIAETISKKLMDWAKIFAFFVGIPLGLLTIILVFYGIKSFSDIEKAKNNVMNNAQKAEEILTKARLLGPKVDGAISIFDQLDMRMSRVEDKVGLFETNIEQDIKDKLNGFIEYLKKIGFEPKKNNLINLKVIVDKKEKTNTKYVQKENIIYLGESIKKDVDLIYREYAMFVLQSSIAELHDMDKEIFDSNYSAIESGLEDYFTCSYTGNPKLGVPTAEFFQKINGKQFYRENSLRDLTNKYKFGDIPNATIYQNGGVWGAAFWNMQELCGKETFNKLLFASWSVFNKKLNSKEYSPENCPFIFVKIILDKDKELNNGKYNAEIKKIFEARGIKIS